MDLSSHTTQEQSLLQSKPCPLISVWREPPSQMGISLSGCKVFLTKGQHVLRGTASPLPPSSCQLSLRIILLLKRHILGWVILVCYSLILGWHILLFYNSQRGRVAEPRPEGAVRKQSLASVGEGPESDEKCILSLPLFLLPSLPSSFLSFCPLPAPRMCPMCSPFAPACGARS